MRESRGPLKIVAYLIDGLSICRIAESIRLTPPEQKRPGQSERSGPHAGGRGRL